MHPLKGMASWTLTVAATMALSAGIVVANHHATLASPSPSPSTAAAASPTTAAAPSSVVTRTYSGDDGATATVGSTTFSTTADN